MLPADHTADALPRRLRLAGSLNDAGAPRVAAHSVGAQSGVSLGSVVLSHTATNLLNKPDGGLPPPPPPFVVHYLIPIDFEQWRGDREAT
jgi:hypothetical protein